MKKAKFHLVPSGDGKDFLVVENLPAAIKSEDCTDAWFGMTSSTGQNNRKKFLKYFTWGNTWNILVVEIHPERGRDTTEMVLELQHDELHKNDPYYEVVSPKQLQCFSFCRNKMNRMLSIKKKDIKDYRITIHIEVGIT